MERLIASRMLERTLRWAVPAGILLLLLMLPGPLNLYRTVRVNLGWIEIARGLVEPGASPEHLRAAQRLLEDGGGGVDAGVEIPRVLAALALLDPVTEYEKVSEWRPLFRGARGEILGVAANRLALRMADDAETRGLLQQAIAWRRLAAGLGPDTPKTDEDPRDALAKRLKSHEELAQGDPPNWQYMLRAVVLNNEAGDLARARYWLEEIPRQFPDPSYSWLHDPANPYAMSALAEAYAYFGLLDKAIEIEAQALQKNSWGYGHSLMARYLLAQRRYAEAESHLQEALALPEPDSTKAQYWVALGDLYAEMGRIPQAQSAYCRVVSSGPGDSRVLHLVAVSAQIPEDSVPGFCSARNLRSDQ